MKYKAAKKSSLFFTKNNVIGLAGVIATFVFVFGITDLAQAQMFSVGGSNGPRFDIPQTELYLGVQPLNVNYEGDASPGNGGGVFEFKGSVIRLGYNSSSFDLFMGTGGKVTGIDGASYFDVGGNIDFGINILRSQKLTLELPLRLASRFTNITNDQALGRNILGRFRFGALTAGAGVRLVSRPATNVRIKVGAIPSYGFSFASGGFFGGSLGSMSAMGRLYFDRLFNNIGLSLGYDYNLRNYDIDDDIYDYKITGHSIEIGITF